jgi:hypothetical protein
MKYDLLKKSSFEKIKNSQISKYTKFEYSIEKLTNGKKIQGNHIRKYFKIFIKIFSINIIPNSKELFVLKNRKFLPNIFYKNIYYKSEKYCKDWW